MTASNSSIRAALTALPLSYARATSLRNSASRSSPSGTDSSSAFAPSLTAPSRPIAPISAVGHAAVKTGAWKPPPAIAMAPRPYPLRRMIAKTGTESAAPASNRSPARRTWPLVSTSGPTMNPGVSISETRGSPNASHKRRNRAALSAPSGSIAPPRWNGLLARSPHGRPAILNIAVIIPAPKPAFTSMSDPGSASVAATSRTS